MSLVSDMSGGIDAIDAGGNITRSVDALRRIVPQL